MAAARGRPAGVLAALAVGLALGGCAAPRPYATPPLVAHAPGSPYIVACPDVLDLIVGPRPNVSGRVEIGPDGAISLGASDRLRVDGLSADGVADRVAD